MYVSCLLVWVDGLYVRLTYLKCGREGVDFTGAKNDLPHGYNSFFRQLDYIVATIANEDFRVIYKGAGEKIYEKEEVKVYSEQKASIFARYRTT